MEDITVRKIVEATRGTILCGDENTVITDICSNTKELKPGDIFVPIIGERVDAHRFIPDALSLCAASFTQEHTAADACMQESGKCVIAVVDTVQAMQDIARMIRRQYPIPIVGVTGSVGKTTTREMIYTALASEKRVFQTQKNYNSQVGVPLTMAKMSSRDEIAVLEMGMSNPHEMEKLADMIRPNTAVMTCIGTAHINQLKTQDNICREKMQIAKYMAPDDVVFLNGDDAILQKHRSELAVKTVLFGLSEGNTYRGSNLHICNGESVFDCVCPSGIIPVRLKAMGEHNVRNALAALAVCDHYGVNLEKAAKALYDFQGQRQQVILTTSFTMIDDTYNASPESMQAALKVLHDFPCKGKRIAVLADMLELGENEIAFHRQVGEAVRENQVDYLITYGSLAQEISRTAAVPFYHAQSLKDVKKQLEVVAGSEDVVLLKGSNGMHLFEVAAQFKK